MIIFGPLLVLLVFFFPRGLVGSLLGWKMRKDMEASVAQKHATSQSREADQDGVKNNA